MMIQSDSYFSGGLKPPISIIYIFIHPFIINDIDEYHTDGVSFDG